jgi:hypothetical protein
MSKDRVGPAAERNAVGAGDSRTLAGTGEVSWPSTAEPAPVQFQHPVGELGVGTVKELADHRGDSRCSDR